VLHEVFQVPFAQIAETTGRTEAGCRQLAHRARSKILSEPVAVAASVQEAAGRTVTDTFIAACATGDLTALTAVLAPDVHGAVILGTHAHRLPAVRGAHRVAANLLLHWGQRATLVTHPSADRPALLALPRSPPGCCPAAHHGSRRHHRHPRRRRPRPTRTTRGRADDQIGWNTPVTVIEPQPYAVAPSGFVRHVMRPMTRVLNPLVLKAAGRRHVKAAAQIRHRGRKSGTFYNTPVGARRVGDQFLIPLTFGTDSDWARNVRAAGECEIRWRGEDHLAAAPEVVKVWLRSRRPSAPN
jgi:deazaflavin-dependent oxidoreductase (nitroreductase family)